MRVTISIEGNVQYVVFAGVKTNTLKKTFVSKSSSTSCSSVSSLEKLCQFVFGNLRSPQIIAALFFGRADRSVPKSSCVYLYPLPFGGL